MASTASPWHSVKSRFTLSMLAIFLASLWSLSYYASRMLLQDMERLLGEQQFSTVSVVAAQVNRAVASRLTALENVADSSVRAMQDGPAAMQTLLEQRSLLSGLFNGGIIAHRLDGSAMAEVPRSAGRVGLNYRADESVAGVLDKGRSAIGQPVMDKTLRAPVFGMTVPIRDAQGRVIGALTGVTHLERPGFLDDVTTGLYGKTGGYLLISAQNRLVLTATDKRHVMETLSAPGLSALVERSLQGHEGPGITVNPLGEEMMTSATRIPLADWLLVATLPASEAYAPIHDMQQRMLLATILLTLLAGALTWWIISRQLEPMLSAARMLSAQSETNQPSQLLPIVRRDEIGQLLGSFNRLVETLRQREDALKRSETFKDVILNSVAAEIAVLDRNGVIRAVNEPWRRFASENGAESGQPAPSTGIGTNYLAACRAGGAFTSSTAQEASRGIQAVLDGRLPSFSLEYPCHSPQHQRWFTMMVMPLGHENPDGVVITHTDITAIKQAEESLRIAAVAFECQEGMLVMDAHRVTLRVNQAFSHITGYAASEVIGQSPFFLRSAHEKTQTYESVWAEVARSGHWQGHLVHRRRNGEDFPSWLTVTAVKDSAGAITHYVSTLADRHDSQQQEAQRLAAEITHRDALVREVHHRIKNNLQGISGVLRQFARNHPQTTEPINQAISQVHSMAVLHGLQGRTSMDTVRLCELTSAIAGDIQSVWQTPVNVDIPSIWTPGIISEAEAVPIALILNELIVNAVKHGGKAHGHVSVALRKGARAEVIQVIIRNSGRVRANTDRPTEYHAGLQLVDSLMPRYGASLAQAQDDNQVITQLELEPPVLHLEP